MEPTRTAHLADVALPVPVERSFSYLVPESLAGAVTPGCRVLCTIGARRIVGIVMAVRWGEPPLRAKPLLDVLGGIALPPDLVSFLLRVAGYYLAPIGEVVRLALPPTDRDAERAVSTPTLFSTTKGVAPRKIQWVEATPIVESSVRAKTAGVLAYVRAHGALPISRLEERFGGARATVKRLVEQRLLSSFEKEAPRDPFFSEPVARDTPPEPTAPQREAMAAIEDALTSKIATTFLLHGVTGSGKTEVYLHAIAAAKKQGSGTIMLVPEIALTPQLVDRFRARFGDDVAVLHSLLTARERFDMWMRLVRGEVDVAIGARSALFAPIANLGLVIVDEEHDPSFKQEEGVRYHARDMSMLRAHVRGGVCVLGSATPSLETEQLSRLGKVKKLTLPDRARAQEMPRVEIIDLRSIGPGPTGDRKLSLLLHRAIEETLAHKEQAILFLNRRGFAPSVRCEGCGELASCPQCSVALTFHKKFGGRHDATEPGGIMRCHWCDYAAKIVPRCPKCSSDRVMLEGLGTEKLEETLAEAFPQARIARLDRDVARGKDIEKVLARVRSREVDILVGTQMVAKGHDLPHVTLVGVVNADAALSIPDFRASERAFQLLVQVAGRAGRGEAKGRVLVQTYDPDHHAIAFAVRHDVPGFVERELKDRRELSYPPFSRMALARIDSLDEAAAKRAAAEIAQAARVVGREGSLDVLGPAVAPIAKVRNRFRFRVMLKSASRNRLRQGMLAMHEAMNRQPRTVRVEIDVDPVGLL